MLNNLSIHRKNIDYLNRDELSLEVENNEAGIFIAQGWFGCMPGQQTLPINDKNNIQPLYFGFHVNEGSWHYLSGDSEFINSLKRHEPIGCRDLGTRDFLRNLKIKAYFSRCLTMTFDKREDSVKPKTTFLIDAHKDIEQFIPQNFKKNIIHLSQENYTSTSYSPSGEWPMNDNDVKKINDSANRRLEILRKKAALVITSRIHIAMPAAALGIPVIFCYPNKYDARASVVQEILPIYEANDFKDIIWDIKATDMENIKKEIKLIFTYRLHVEENKLGLKTKRLSKEDFLIAKNLVENACREKAEKEVIKYKTKSFNKDDVLRIAFGQHLDLIIKQERPLVLFGAGSAGSHLSSIIKYFGIYPVCFCDNNVKIDNEKFCNNLPIITFDYLKKNHRNSLILITTKYFLEPIKKQLFKNGFSENQIIEGTSLIENYIDFAVPQAKDNTQGATRNCKI